MSAKELTLDGGLNSFRVTDIHSPGGEIAVLISNEPVGRSSMMAVLDPSQQNLLMLYLQERLGSRTAGQ